MDRIYLDHSLRLRPYPAPEACLLFSYFGLRRTPEALHFSMTSVKKKKHYIFKIGQYKLGLLLALLLLPLSLLLLGLVLDLEQLTLVLYLPYLPYYSYCYGWETRLGRNRINGHKNAL